MRERFRAIVAGLLLTLAALILWGHPAREQHATAARQKAKAAEGKPAKAAGGKTAIAGVLMDKACSAENNTTAKALKHGKDCAEMEDCVKSGYGVVTAEGKFLAFDAAGNQQAAAFLKQFKGSSAIKVKVEGAVEGSTVKVTSIKAG